MTRIKHSLQLQLSLTITVLLLIIALISGSLSFYETYHQTHKIQDDLLRQIAAYINPSQPLPKSQKSKNASTSAPAPNKRPTKKPCPKPATCPTASTPSPKPTATTPTASTPPPLSKAKSSSIKKTNTATT